MALSYDQRKKSYDSMDDSQKQQYNDAIKNKGDDYIGNQYMKQYQQANAPQSNNNSSNFNNLTKEYQDGNGWRSMNYDDWKKEYEGMDDAGKQGYSKFLDSQKDDYWGRGFLDTYKQEQVANANPELDTSKFGATNGKVSVKEGTAAQTGMPDYQLNSEARMREITDNLNAYWANNPEFFKDRNTFNQMFHYSERDNEQRALLDTYWKKKLDMDNASKYNTADGIKSGMNDADITPDQLNYIKEYSPEAYQEWQQKQQDEINLRIANLATPADPTDNAELFNTLLTKLGLEPGDPYQIYENWYNMAERLGVFSDSEKLKSYQNQLDANHSKMESIMSRYSSSTGGTVSDTLAAARMQKALAPYQQREVDLQNSYTTLLNGRNSNLAIANQSAQALAMQAQEDQRIWNQRLQGLGFAMSTASYRTPEQQAQLQLQTASIQNDLNLLNQSKLNDLNRYNAYATAKMQNQLQQELTDLSVEDETQLKANLNNALSDYYKNYGDIIQRSQAQAVEDIIAYAKKNGISVAQAMTENFIKPLQNKAEYKQKVATDYGMLKSQSIGTINGRSVIMTTNPNGTISYQYLDDLDSEGVRGDMKPYNQVDSKVMTAAPADYGYKTLGTFLMDKKDGQKAGQCGKFVNDYLEYIGVGRYYDDDLSTKLNSVNTTLATEGAIAVFDYNHKSSDGINHGHVGIVTKVYDDGSFDVIDSNYDTKNPGKITKRHINAGTASLKGFFDPSQPPRATSTGSSLGTIDEAKKQNYLEEARRGQMTDSNVAKIGDIAAEQGWSEEWREALKQGYSVNLTDAQVKRMDKEDGTFLAHSDVKAFTEARTQFGQLVDALNDASGVGDMSAIFTFMKTLDPSSVVRESEFNSAAATAGVLNPQAILQSLEKNIDGKFLTPKQREDFKKIAREFITRKATAYQTQYDHLLDRYKSFGVDAELAPTNLATELLDYMEMGTSTGPDDALSEIYSSAMNTNYSNASYGGYSSDFISQMINSKL